jgi:hypothetical protein
MSGLCRGLIPSSRSDLEPCAEHRLPDLRRLDLGSAPPVRPVRAAPAGLPFSGRCELAFIDGNQAEPTPIGTSYKHSVVSGTCFEQSESRALRKLDARGCPACLERRSREPRRVLDKLPGRPRSTLTHGGAAFPIENRGYPLPILIATVLPRGSSFWPVISPEIGSGLGHGTRPSQGGRGWRRTGRNRGPADD